MEPKAIASTVGAILINLTLGTFYSIGNLVPYVASYMRAYGNPSVTSENGTWITAAFLLGQGIFILVGSFIEQKFDSRVGCIVGCIIHCLSTFATIWAIDVSFLAVILIYGFGSGLGCGSAYMSSIINAHKWFPKNKGIATGIIVAGFGLGGLIFTTLQTLYLNPNNLPQNVDRYFEGAVYNRVPNMLLYMGIIFTVAQTIGCALAFPAQPMGSSPVTPTEISASGQVPSGVVVTEDMLPDVKSFSQIFTNRMFYVIGLLMVLVAPGVTFVNSLGKIYGQSFITDDKYLASVVAAAAIANASGRLTWGYLMDKFSFITCYSIKIILFATLMITFPFGFVLQSTYLYLIWMLGLFFGFSGTFVIIPVFVEQVFGLKFSGIIYGILYIFLALSSNVTSLMIQVTVVPALAKVKKASDSLSIRLIPCACIAALYLISLVLYIYLVPVKRLEHAIKRRREVEDMKQKTSLFNRQDLFPLSQNPLGERIRDAQMRPGHASKEDSLGSIVKIRDAANDDARIKNFTRTYMNGFRFHL